MFSIDGTPWDVPCQIQRESQMQASDISGMLLDRTYFNDVIGTYMSYQVAIAVPFTKAALYNTIYNMLSDPVEAHIFVLPYNASTITITGRVENVSDSWVRMPGDANHWRQISFTVTAIHPSRYYSLNQAISRGRPIVPTIDGSREAVLEALTVTANGTYTPDTGVDGFNSVTVNVPQGSDDPADNLIEKWDFRQSVNGIIRNFLPVRSNVTKDENGILFDQSNGYVRFQGSPMVYAGMNIEIDVESMSLEGTDNQRFIITGANGEGLYYNATTNRWAFKGSSTSVASRKSETLEGHTVRVKLNGSTWIIYVDGAAWFSPGIAAPLNYVQIGSSENSLLNTRITAMRIY